MAGNTDGDSDEDSQIQTTGAEATSHSSSTWKVLGELETADATGVLGHNTAGSGTGIGVEGVTDSSNAAAVGVRANAPSGGRGLEASASGNLAIDAQSTGDTAINAVTTGKGFNALEGYNYATDGLSWGVRGDTDSTHPEAHGVKGHANPTDGAGNGVSGTTYGSGDGATGVHGEATAGSGTTYGVYGVTQSSAADAAGVLGSAPNGGYGVYSNADSKTVGDHEVTGSQTVGSTGASIVKTSNQSVDGNRTRTTVEFDSAPTDHFGGWDGSTYQYYFQEDGDYHIDCGVGMSLPDGTEQEMWITIVSGSDTGYDLRTFASSPTNLEASRTFFGLSSGDYMSVDVAHRDSTSQDILGKEQQTYLTITKVG